MSDRVGAGNDRQPKSWFSLTCRTCGRGVNRVHYGVCETCQPVVVTHPNDPRAIKFSAYIAGVDTR